MQPREIVLLMALRRAERKPDPLAIELNTDSDRTAAFPNLPTILVRLKNVDPTESFYLTRGVVHDGGGRPQCCRIDAIDSEGVHVVPLPNTPWTGNQLTGEGRLTPGEAIGLGVNPAQFALDPEPIDLRQYIVLPHPGEYRLRVQYHDEETIAGEADDTGWILASSQPFLVRLER
jgi:hypothetical protein